MAHCLGPSQEVVKLAVLDCSSDKDAARRALAFSDYAAVELWCGSRWVCQVNPVKRGDEVSSAIARAAALLKDDRAEDAMADYRTAVKLDPLNAEAHCGTGKALHVLSRYADAIPSYDRAIELKPDFIDAHLARGVALAALGRLQEAVRSYYQALSIDPNNADVYKYTGDLLATRGSAGGGSGHLSPVRHRALHTQHRSRLPGNGPPLSQRASAGRLQCLRATREIFLGPVATGPKSSANMEAAF